MTRVKCAHEGNDYLPLQANIICLLLALIGST